MDMVGVRRGVLGGTFDPVHNGHLAIAEESRKEAGLADVIFVPAPRPWQKTRQLLTPVSHRVEMLRLAIEDRPYFCISNVDINRAGPSYTIDTILDLRREMGENGELYFILGWDSLESLPTWREAPRLVQLCYLVAARRPGFRRPDLAALDNQIPGVASRVIVLNGPRADISASSVRERVARGLDIDGLVPGPVSAYINEHKLYAAG